MIEKEKSDKLALLKSYTVESQQNVNLQQYCEHKHVCLFVYYLEHVHTTHNSMSKYTCKHVHQTTCPWRQ